MTWLETLLRNSSSPEQINFLTNFFVINDNDQSGTHRHVKNIELLTYVGAIAGSEFLVYNRDKLYICYNIDFNSIAGIIADQSVINFFNELNSNIFTTVLNKPYWDNTASLLKYTGENYSIKNLYFSRVTTSYINTINFNGYRVTLD